MGSFEKPRLCSPVLLLVGRTENIRFFNGVSKFVQDTIVTHHRDDADHRHVVVKFMLTHHRQVFLRVKFG